MERLRLGWLGNPTVEFNGQVVKLETRKSTALLAYLSMTSNGCQREILASMLWPDGSQQKSLANLRRSLSSLNSRLPGWIEADRETIRLHREDGAWIDVDSFHQSLATIRAHCEQELPVCESCLSLLEEAVKSYRGDFLEGLNLSDSPDFDHWQLFQREGLRREFAWVLELLVITYAGREQRDKAIDYARRWLALEPLHEPACRMLMELYSQDNRRSDALTLFKQFSDLLSQELEQEPEQETKRLYKQIAGLESTTDSYTETVAFPILRTKLYIPGILPNRVQRNLLLEHMDEVERKALTIISAPAGFGKTTLLAEWIAQSSLPIAWLSVDNGENDPYGFLSYLIAALESIAEEIGIEARQLMQSSPVVTPNILLASLLNDIARIPTPFALVLDDYQFITDPAVHGMLTYLLDHIPWNTHIVIASRIDPPLPLGKLRAQDQMLEIRTRDLRFNLKEAEEFFNIVFKLGLSVTDIDRLEDRTEGWIVGLQMAAIALRDHGNPSEFIKSFSGTHRYVLDYLMDEVLNQQPAYIQQFLIATSILDRLIGSLCEALLGDALNQTEMRGHDFLEHLEMLNLFIIPLDDERIWFRYHHLFADLLVSRLKHQNPELERTLHEKAARWFAEHNRPVNAIHHALAARDFPLAADLIERYAFAMLAHSEIATLWQWIQSLPTDLVQSRPRLIIYSAWVKVRMGNPGNLEKQLQKAESLLDNSPKLPDDDDLRGYLTLLQSYMANIQDNPDLAISSALKGVGHVNLPTGKVTADNHLIGFQLGYAYYSKGDLETAEQILQWVSKNSQRSDDPYNWVLSYVELAGIQLLRGSMSEAERIYQQTMEGLARQVDSPAYLDGILKVCQANILLERNELKEAMQLVEEGIEHATLGCRTNTLAHGYAILSNIYRAQGELVHARKAVDRAINQTEQNRIYPRTVNEVKVSQINLWLAEGNLMAARQWVKEILPTTGLPLKFIHELEHITLVRVLLASEQFESGLALLNRLAEEAEAGRRGGRLIFIHLLQAIALYQLGNIEDALQMLTKSLEIAQPERHLRVFLNEGSQLEDIIRFGKQRRRWHGSELESYIERILLAFRESIYK
jgi:LuxR family maltose regulon positive regulatory protein